MARSSWGRFALAVGADLLVVAFFVGVGRSSHAERMDLVGVLTTGWPFALGVGAGHSGVALARWPVLGWRAGAGVALKTVIVGMVLRSGVQHEGTPPSFILVATLVIGGLMLGWRGGVAVILRKRQLRVVGPRIGSA